jgi:hypothetical protein
LGEGTYWHIIRSGNITMSTPLGYDPGRNFYVWRASDDFAIHLSLQVVTQLNAQISRAGSDGQPAGLRGILLGRTVESPFRATIIEDFTLLPTSEGRGNRDSDDALFEISRRMAEAASEQQVVGFFRTRRDGTLNMGWRDLETFSRLFCETGNVALLIQTSGRGNESEAALFYWQNGGAFPRDFGFGFPLEAGQLADGHPGWRYPDPLQAPKPAPQLAPEPPAPERTKVARAPYRAAPESIRWPRLSVTALLVVLGIGTLQLATKGGNQTGLGLTVASHPHQLEIRWNRQAEAIAASSNGVMKITESGKTAAVPIDQDQLHDGFVAYTPTTNDVSIRLEVTGPDGGTTSESIRTVAIP